MNFANLVVSVGFEQTSPKRRMLAPTDPQMGAMPRNNALDILGSKPRDNSRHRGPHAEQNACSRVINACGCPRKHQCLTGKVGSILSRKITGTIAVRVSPSCIFFTTPPVLARKVQIENREVELCSSFEIGGIKIAPQRPVHSRHLGAFVVMLRVRKGRKNSKAALVELLYQLHLWFALPHRRSQRGRGGWCTAFRRRFRHVVQSVATPTIIVMPSGARCCDGFADYSAKPRALG